MEEIQFNSQEELYERIHPALMSKKKMLKINGFKYIKEQDIWDYLRYNKWNRSNGLELCDMVSDILNTDNMLIVEYYHNKYILKQREIEENLDLPKLKSE